MDFKVGDMIEWREPSTILKKLQPKGPFVITKIEEFMDWLYMDEFNTGKPLSIKTGGMPADAWPAMAYKLCDPFMVAVHKAILQEKIMAKLWLDDVREPWRHGAMGFEWAKTADEAIALLKKGNITFASLDHDLAAEHYCPPEKLHDDPTGALTGYDVVCWMEENNVWPEDGVEVHSMNPVGRARMQMVIDRHYNIEREGVALYARDGRTRINA